MLPRKIPVIRVMSNTPVLVRAGASVFSCGTATRAGDASLTKKLFSAVGLCEVSLILNFQLSENTFEKQAENFCLDFKEKHDLT